MGRDPGGPDDKGQNKDLPPPDEILVTTGRDLEGEICLFGSSSSPGPSDDMFGVPKCDIELEKSPLMLLREHIHRQPVQAKLCWELILAKVRWEKLHQEKLRWKKLQEKLRREKLRRGKLQWRELHWEELHREELRREELRWEELLVRLVEHLQKLRSEFFVQGTSSATGKISVSSSISHYSFPHSGTSSAMGKRIVEGLDMCMTCKWQFPHSERFCSCQHTAITVKARPRWSASSEGTITMHNPGSSDEVNGFARENVDIKTGPGPTFRPPVPILTKPNMWDEIKSEPSQASVSFSSHGFAGFAGKDGDIEMGLGHTVRPPVPIVPMPNVSDENTSEPSQASDSFSSHGFAGNDSGIKMVLGHTLCHPAPIPTMPNVSDETTLEPSQASDSSSSHDFAPTDSDIERGRTHSSDLVPSEPRLGDFCSYHHAYERNWQRLSTVVDPLLAGIVQIGCSLVAFKTSDGSSPAEDVLFYLLVIICVLGFLYPLAGKWFHCAKMAMIGLVATALSFLMTVALAVMYKIR